MMEIPEEFRLFARSADQWIRPETDMRAMVNIMYCFMAPTGGPTEEWLRRGHVVADFLEKMITEIEKAPRAPLHTP